MRRKNACPSICAQWGLDPEAVWDLQANEFGPLVVGMDTHGQSIYKNLKEAALHKIDEAYPA